MNRHSRPTRLPEAWPLIVGGALFALALLYQVHTRTRLRRATVALQQHTVLQNQLEPLSRQWQHYQTLEAATPAIPRVDPPVITDPLPPADLEQIHRRQSTPVWHLVEWQAEWENLQFAALPTLFRLLSESEAPWRITRLSLEPDGDPGRGRLVLAAAALEARQPE